MLTDVSTLLPGPARSANVLRTASDLMRHIPGRIWLDATRRGWDDLALIGMEAEPRSVAAHLRSHTVVAYVDGRSRLTRRFRGRELTEPVGSGDLALKSFGTTGEWSWDRPNNTIQVFLSPYLLQRVADEIYGPRAGCWQLRDCVRVRDDEVFHLVEALAREAESKEPGSTIMIRTLAQQLAVRLIRHHADLVPEAEPGHQVFGSNQRRQILEFIASHLNQTISVTALARRENLSIDRFTRLFRTTFDCSPQEQVRRMRLQRVHELMKDPSLSLAEIAYETGFTDQSHLTRVFKHQYGEPPGIWRRQRAVCQSGTAWTQ